MGFLVGVANAFTTSFQNSFFKKLPGVSSFVLNWYRFAVALPILALLVSVFSEWRAPGAPLFWGILLGVSLPVELAQSYFYVASFQRSPQSIIGPLFTLSVLFLVPLSYVVNGEIPSPLGFLGIISVILGPFFLGWQSGGLRFSTALRSVWHEPGTWRMLASAFFAALAVTFSKFSYRYVPPLVFAFYITAALFVVISVYLLLRRQSLRPAAKFETLGMSASYGFGQALHYVGLSLLLAAYYISVKRLSVIFDVIFGRFMHREEHFGKRMIGAVLMVAGVVLVAFG